MNGMEFVAEINGRLDVILLSALPHNHSRHRIKRAIEGGAVTVNGVTRRKAGTKVKLGDRVVVSEGKIPPPPEERLPVPAPTIPLDVLYEDGDCLVVNKSSGLLTHPTPTRLEGTLAGALLARIPALASVGESPMRPGLVHRLDEGTSGLLVVAKTQPAFEFLKRQFMGRHVRKTYLALVEGNPKEKEGVIEYAIRPSATNPAKRVAVKKVLPRGTETAKRTSAREAETRYRVLESFGNTFTLIELHPKTGRTHQLRVHLAAIGHPVVGDPLYGAKTPAPRLMLHATRLEFIRPNHKPLALESPLPEDFRIFLNKLK